MFDELWLPFVGFWIALVFGLIATFLAVSGLKEQGFVEASKKSAYFGLYSLLASMIIWVLIWIRLFETDPQRMKETSYIIVFSGVVLVIGVCCIYSWLKNIRR